MKDDGPDINKIPEMDATAIQQRCANQVKDSVERLNRHLEKAAAAGLHLELETCQISPIGGPRHPIIHVRVLKEM